MNFIRLKEWSHGLSVKSTKEIFNIKTVLPGFRQENRLFILVWSVKWTSKRRTSFCITSLRETVDWITLCCFASLCLWIVIRNTDVEQYSHRRSVSSEDRTYSVIIGTLLLCLFSFYCFSIGCLDLLIVWYLHGICWKIMSFL